VGGLPSDLRAVGVLDLDSFARVLGGAQVEQVGMGQGVTVRQETSERRKTMNEENAPINEVHVYKDVSVAGVTFEGRQRFVKMLNPRSTVKLEADPDNPYDPNAVKVIADGNHVGFVPRNLAAALKEWDTYTGVITRLPSKNRTHGIRLTITAERPKVKVRCVVCKATKEVGPNDVAPGDHPMCDKCMSPMVPVNATSDEK
jgi:hypothetical protein